jgi:putative thioredoxin
MLDLGLMPVPPPQNAAFADITARDFEAEVLQAASPVIVQFWAPWCGPCKQLKPVLEKAVAAAAGAVRMVRVNIDENPDLAQALRVQSVPMVYAFHQGQPVDGFVGVRPESEIKAFVTRLAALGGGAAAAEGAVDAEARDKIMATAQQHFADGQLMEALAAYSTAYDLDPSFAPALAGMAWCFVASKDAEAFDAITSELDDGLKGDAALAGVLRLHALRAEAAGLDAAALRAAVAANPADHAARLDLARAEVAALDLGAAIDHALAIIKADRAWQDGAAREWLVALLDALGPAHPLTRPARRQLSSILFS